MLKDFYRQRHEEKKLSNLIKSTLEWIIICLAIGGFIWLIN